MNLQEKIWSAGKTDAPPPPVADLRKMETAQDFLLEEYLELGPVFRVPLPEHPFTVLSGQEVNGLVSRSSGEFLSTQEPWHDFDVALGAIMPREGEGNRQRRALISRGYSRGPILEQIPHMVEIVREYTQSWQPGQLFPVLGTNQAIVAEQLGQTLIHFSPKEYISDFVRYINAMIAVKMQHTRPESELTTPEFLATQKQVIELGRQILAVHRDGSLGEHKPDIVDDMLTAASYAPDQFTEESLIVAATGPLLAGLDTVASSNSFFLYALLKNPAVLKRLTDELDHAFAAGPLTWDVLKKMPVLHGAAMESLRLYPVAGAQPYVATQDFVLAGYQVERGENIIVNNIVTHYLPELFPDPFTFDVDRFSDPRNEHRQRGAYVPFGLGEHTCLGSGIAEIQLMVVTATILHDFELALETPDFELHPILDPLPSPGRSFSLRVVGRRH